MPPDISTKDQPSTKRPESMQPGILQDTRYEQLNELRRDLPLSVQRPGSFIKFVDKRYPELVARWTAPQEGTVNTTTAKSANEEARGIAKRRSVKVSESTLSTNTESWNDIPDDMLNVPQRRQSASLMNTMKGKAPLYTATNNNPNNSPAERLRMDGTTSGSNDSEPVLAIPNNVDEIIARNQEFVATKGYTVSMLIKSASHNYWDFGYQSVLMQEVSFLG